MSNANASMNDQFSKMSSVIRNSNAMRPKKQPLKMYLTITKANGGYKGLCSISNPAIPLGPKKEYVAEDIDSLMTQMAVSVKRVFKVLPPASEQPATIPAPMANP